MGGGKSYRTALLTPCVKPVRPSDPIIAPDRHKRDRTGTELGKKGAGRAVPGPCGLGHYLDGQRTCLDRRRTPAWGTIEGQGRAARLPRAELFLIAGQPRQRPLPAQDRGIVVDRSCYRFLRA